MRNLDLFSQLQAKHLPYIKNSNVIKTGLIIFILLSVLLLFLPGILKLAVLGGIIVFISIYMKLLYAEILRILNIQFTNERSAQQTSTIIGESGLDEDVLNDAINDPYGEEGDGGGDGGGDSNQGGETQLQCAYYKNEMGECHPLVLDETNTGCCRLQTSQEQGISPELQVALNVGAEIAKGVAVSVIIDSLPKLMRYLRRSQRLLLQQADDALRLGRKLTVAQKFARRISRMQSALPRMQLARTMSRGARTGIRNASRFIGAKAGKMAAKIGLKASSFAIKMSNPVGWALLAFDLFSLGLDLADPRGYTNFTENAHIYNLITQAHISIEQTVNFQGGELPYMFPLEEAFPQQYEDCVTQVFSTYQREAMELLSLQIGLCWKNMGTSTPTGTYLQGSTELANYITTVQAAQAAEATQAAQSTTAYVRISRTRFDELMPSTDDENFELTSDYYIVDNQGTYYKPVELQGTWWRRIKTEPSQSEGVQLIDNSSMGQELSNGKTYFTMSELDSFQFDTDSKNIGDYIYSSNGEYYEIIDHEWELLLAMLIEEDPPQETLSAFEHAFSIVVNKNPQERDQRIYNALIQPETGINPDYITIYSDYSTTKRIAVSLSVKGVRWWNNQNRAEWFQYNDIFDSSVVPPTILGLVWSQTQLSALPANRTDKSQQYPMLVNALKYKRRFTEAELAQMVTGTLLSSDFVIVNGEYYQPLPYKAPPLCIYSDYYMIVDPADPGTDANPNTTRIDLNEKIPMYLPMGGRAWSFCEKFRNAQFLNGIVPAMQNDANDGIDPKQYCVYFDDGTGKPLWKDSTPEGGQGLQVPGCTYSDKFCTRMGLKFEYSNVTNKTECVMDGDQEVSELLFGTTITRANYEAWHAVGGFTCNPCCEPWEYCENNTCHPKKQNGEEVGLTAWWKCLSARESAGRCTQCRDGRNSIADDCDQSTVGQYCEDAWGHPQYDSCVDKKAEGEEVPGVGERGYKCQSGIESYGVCRDCRDGRNSTHCLSTHYCGDTWGHSEYDNCTLKKQKGEEVPGVGERGYKCQSGLETYGVCRDCRDGRNSTHCLSTHYCGDTWGHSEYDSCTPKKGIGQYVPGVGERGYKCESGLEVLGYCRECKDGNNGYCTEDKYCENNWGSNHDKCMPKHGNGTNVGWTNGRKCISNQEINGICHGGLRSLPPGANVGMGNGRYCTSGAEDWGNCISLKNEGEYCGGNGHCVSGWCHHNRCAVSGAPRCGWWNGNWCPNSRRKNGDWWCHHERCIKPP